MSENYKEAFEKTRSAGIIASGPWTRLPKLLNQELALIKLINYVSNILMSWCLFCTFL